jgi:hypothetical protein
LITYTHNNLDKDTAYFDGLLLNVSEFPNLNPEDGEFGAILIGAQDRDSQLWTYERDDVPHK